MFEINSENRRKSALILVLLSLLIAYNTFMPFRFYTSLSKIAGQLALIEWLPFRRNNHWVGWTDILGNILLFFPVGMSAGYFFLMKNTGRKRSLYSTIVYSMALSLFIETVQIALRYRVTSVHDVFTNTLGGALGGYVMMSILTERGRRYLARVFFKIYEYRYRIIVYCLTFLAMGNILYISEGRYWPINIPLMFLSGYFYAPAHFRAWVVYYSLLGGGTLILYFFPHRILNMDGYRGLMMFTLYGIAVWGGKQVKSQRCSRAAALLYIVLFYTYPFTYHGWKNISVTDFLKHLTPFYFYYKTTGFQNLWDMGHIFFLGVLTGYVFLNRKKEEKRATIAAALAIVVLETGQWFINSRIFDMTDILIAMSGLIFYRSRSGLLQFINPAIKKSTAARAPAVSA